MGNNTYKVIIIGLIAGMVSGFFGLGGGIVFVPAMVMLLKFDQHTAHGTSLMVIIPTALFGTITYSISGYFNLEVALWVVIGGMTGAYIGAWAANKLSAQRLRAFYALFLATIAIKMIIG